MSLHLHCENRFYATTKNMFTPHNSKNDGIPKGPYVCTIKSSITCLFGGKSQELWIWIYIFLKLENTVIFLSIVGLLSFAYSGEPESGEDRGSQ